MKKLFTVPNALTFLRIIGAVAMIFVEPISMTFYIIYSLCGISDVLDGMTARALKQTGEFGAKLDSVSDLIFYTVMILRVFPKLYEMLPVFIWFIVGGVIAVRIFSYTLAAIKFKRFSSCHTYLNKLTGFSVFLVPYLMSVDAIVVYCFGVCAVGMTASCEELLIHLTEPKYDSNRKSFFIKNTER